MPQDLKVVRDEQQRKQYEADERKKELDKLKKREYFYALRKRVSENDAVAVRWVDRRKCTPTTSGRKAART